MLRDLKDRSDVRVLVENFYAKIRKNTEIGYFFNGTISNWDEHLEKLTDFWESNLFFSANFHGNPAVAHANLDKQHDNTITEYHFGIWLNLWFQTIDELFKVEMAERLKHNARKMSTHLCLRI